MRSVDRASWWMVSNEERFTASTNSMAVLKSACGATTSASSSSAHMLDFAKEIPRN